MKLGSCTKYFQLLELYFLLISRSLQRLLNCTYKGIECSFAMQFEDMVISVITTIMKILGCKMTIKSKVNYSDYLTTDRSKEQTIIL